MDEPQELGNPDCWYVIVTTVSSFIQQWLYNPLLGLGWFFSFLTVYTAGRTLWTGGLARIKASQDIKMNSIPEDEAARGSVVVKTLCCKPDEVNEFFNLPNLPTHWSLGFTQPGTEMSTRSR
jgi:hypothetical protein